MIDFYAPEHMTLNLNAENSIPSAEDLSDVT
jgi:hypothetical protein